MVRKKLHSSISGYGKLGYGITARQIAVTSPDLFQGQGSIEIPAGRCLTTYPSPRLQLRERERERERETAFQTEISSHFIVKQGYTYYINLVFYF